MPLEKCAKMIRLVKDARSLAADLLFAQNPRAAAPKVLLLALLYRMQALAVSLQADLIDATGDTEPTDEIVRMHAEFAGEDPAREAARQPKAVSRCKVIPFDRRRIKPDRRRIPTYIARDRRSGVVDRRRRRQAQHA